MSEHPSAVSQRDPDLLAVRLLALAAVLLVVVQILAQGYLPVDDALRHAAKAVSGKPWSEILVARPGLIDFSPGWHAFLHAVHLIFDANAHTLVWVGILVSFACVSLPALLLMARPEAWLAAMTIGALFEPQLATRWVIGRPLVISMAILVYMCLTWRRLDAERLPRRALVVAGLLVAAATWIHGSWYLWALPILACLLAGQRRVAARLAIATAIGVMAGALLTGRSIDFLTQNLALALNLGGGAVSAWVYEMQAYPFVPLLMLVLAVLVIVRKVWLDVPAKSVMSDPVFMLAALGCLLGVRSARFWMDWGMPAAVVFIALELERLWIAFAPWGRRLLMAGAVAGVAFVVWTANVNQRWMPRLDRAIATIVTTRPAALPDSGGILYTDDRRVFYEMFYLDPKAPWRHTLGFSPELMPREDYAVYVNRHTTGTIEALEPWARKMKPADRLLIRDPRGIQLWNWLEWQALEGGFFSGRVKR
jgi:hypothetical protein